MKTIRHSAFETNSSSTHSISIDEQSKVLTSIRPDAEGIIYLRGGEFGWEWARVTDALTKANYCAVDALSNNDRLQMLKEVIMEHTGAKDVIVKITTDFDSSNHSYIDHQSCGTSDTTFASKEQLKNFIFCPDSILFIGNDNGSPPPNFYDKYPEQFTHYVKLQGTNECYYVYQNIEKQTDKLHEIIHCLFERSVYNKYSDFNKESFFGMGWTTRNDALDYRLPYGQDYIDIEKKTVKTVCEKYNADKQEYVCVDTKFLHYEILPR